MGKNQLRMGKNDHGSNGIILEEAISPSKMELFWEKQFSSVKWETI